MECPQGQTFADQLVWVCRYFSAWTEGQRRKFLAMLLSMIVPGKVCVLADSLDQGLQFAGNDPPFAQELDIILNWLNSWTDAQKNQMLACLEDIDYWLIRELDTKIAETAGQL